VPAEEADAFISEFKRWRDVRGMSQSRLAPAMGYHRSYLSKIENGQERPTREFVQRAEEILQTGGALTRAFRDTLAQPQRQQARLEPEESIGSIAVEHDHARLVYDGATYHAFQRRRLFNGGQQPITRYLVRISVDRYPGSPERSNQLYRDDPLTWDELGLVATHGEGGPMTWQVQHDRDAFKELWLLFENDGGRFPLYPGESATIEYSYSVTADKWGRWFQRAVRLPTRHLSVELDFPTELDPAVWGTETTMTADALPLHTAIRRTVNAARTRFAWSTDEPPLHARYRLEWKFRADPRPPEPDTAPAAPSRIMRALGIIQADDPGLHQPSRPFDLPADAEDARRVVAQLHSILDQVAAAHTFSKGMGLAAPQIGIDRAAAIIQAPDGQLITLLNPTIIEESTATDEQYEGCLSFFDVRGMVPRPLAIHVEHQDTGGNRHITAFNHGLARLVAHEIDHVHGTLYTDRMRPDIDTIPVSEYSGTGRAWKYRGP
jgi:peptide deformylase